ncbi:MAG: peptidoglycan editing factor PgeF [Deltaproteobacteria bacterium]
MFSLEKKNSIAYLQAPLMKACDFLTHAFCTRIGGASRDDYKSLNMSFREGDEEFRVLANWDKLSLAFEIPMENFLVLNQVHGDNIFVIKPHGDYFTSRETLNYDAIVTNRTNLAICIKTADCVPVFIVDRIKKIIAAVHAGWRGSALGITAKVVRLMQNQYGSKPQDLLAAIGPSIGRCCYEVDAPAADAFRQQKNAEDFLFPGKRKDRWMLDLVEANRRQLLDGGIPDTNIETSGLCTVCRQDAFFSHRGSGGITGRQINFMMIKGDPPCRVLMLDEVSKAIQ